MNWFRRKDPLIPSPSRHPTTDAPQGLSMGQKGAHRQPQMPIMENAQVAFDTYAQFPNPDDSAPGSHRDATHSDARTGQIPQRTARSPWVEGAMPAPRSTQRPSFIPPLTAPVESARAAPPARPPKSQTQDFTQGAAITSLTQGGHRQISSLAEFPRREAVLSGPSASSPGLQIPASLQDHVLVVRIDATRAVLVYDPAHTARVKSYFAPLRSATMAQGLLMDGVPLLASSEVLRDVRLAAEAAVAKSSQAGASSGGAKLFRQWVEAAKASGATDVHLSIIDGGRGQVSMRVDGELEPIEALSQGVYTDRDVRNAMKAAFENMADLHSNNDGTFSDAKSMSCMIDSRLGLPNVRLRFSSQRGFFGPKVVCRLLHSELDMVAMPFANMGLAPSQVELLHRAQRLESGAIVQTGVTGSGKTTAAKTFIETHPKNGLSAMYAVADPIEYLLRNVHQIYVQRDLITLETAGKKDPYSEVIESLMRMDPDLIDVGEVRDQISARAVANVAKSGHVALCTLHTDSLGGVINRLSDPKLGLTRQELTSSKVLGFMSYQALLAKLCQCATDQATAQQWHGAHQQHHEVAYIDGLIATITRQFGLEPDRFRFRNPEGCVHCRHRGTRGLTMVAEMMMPDDDWLDIAANGNDRAAMRHWRNTYSDRRVESANMEGKLVVEHTLYKALSGEVDPRNIERFGPLDQLEVLS
jgi:general secretion pathway protein E